MNDQPMHLAANEPHLEIPEGLTPKAPIAGNWKKLTPPAGGPAHTDFYQHQGTGVGVVSSFGFRNDTEVAYLLAMGRKGSRQCPTGECQMVLAQFGLADASEVQLAGQDFTRNFIAPIPFIAATPRA